MSDCLNGSHGRLRGHEVDRTVWMICVECGEFVRKMVN